MKKRAKAHTALLVCATAGLAVALLLLIYFQAVGRKSDAAIVLPPDASETTPPPVVSEGDEALFLTVDRNNVLDIIRSLARPACYHQSMDVTMYWGEGESKKTVDVYCKGGVVKAVIEQAGQRRHILSDTETLYVWYDGDETAFETRLAEAATLETLLGVPTYETVLDLPPEAVTEAGYLTMGEPETACIYLSCRLTEDGYTDRYWIDVNSQMLYQADAQFQGEQFYAVRQTAIAVYTELDDTAQWDFSLPDGTQPFAGKLTEMQTPQPSE